MEYKGEGIDPARPHHMKMHALQTVLHLNKTYLSDLLIPRTCTQNRLLYTLNSEKCRLNNAKQIQFFGMQN